MRGVKSDQALLAWFAKRATFVLDPIGNTRINNAQGVMQLLGTFQEATMQRIWTIIGVRDVPGSFKWYQSLFGQPETQPGHTYFAQLVDSDGMVLLCLHEWGAHDHPTLVSPDNGTPGNGLLLFFRVDNFDSMLTNARALGAQFEEEPHTNPNTQTREFSLRDPDGYYVSISELAAVE